IYRFRGASARHLEQFRRDYPGAQLFRLEQNYRSTGTILEAANGLIGHNASRLGKKLWTAGARGEPIRLYTAFNERDEAEFVTHRIREHVSRGGSRRCAGVPGRTAARCGRRRRLLSRRAERSARRRAAPSTASWRSSSGSPPSAVRLRCTSRWTSC